MQTKKYITRLTTRWVSFAISAAMLTLFLLSGCSVNGGSSSGDQSGTEQSAASDAATSGSVTQTTTTAVAGQQTSPFKAGDATVVSGTGATTIQLRDTGTKISGTGATVKGSVVTITKQGTYKISGSLKNGQIVVNATDKADVVVLLNGITIANSTGPAIYIGTCDKTVLTAVAGTTNTLSDGSKYTPESGSDEAAACIYSKSDLVINGTGTLMVTGNCSGGITSKDSLRLLNATIGVTAAGNGIKGKDYVAAKSCKVTVTAKGGDGLKSTNSTDTKLGYVYLESGSWNITAANDGIQAQTTLTVLGGSYTIKSGGGSANASTKSGWGQWGPMQGGNASSTETASAKGLKGLTGVVITGGTFQLDTSDDSIHSNKNVTVAGGTITASSGDDGIHADANLTITGGNVTISKSYEGLEGSVIAIEGGNIHVTASDDGLNAAGGNDSSSTNGRPGQNAFAADSSKQLTISGGTLVVDAGGDGLDSNGALTITGGVTLVSGPTDNGNGALDSGSGVTIKGGVLLAAGSSGMAEKPETSSAQNSLAVFTTLSKGTIFRVTDASGKALITFEIQKQAQSVIFSSPDLKKGSAYTVYTGGSCTGTKTDGLYSGGSYSGGTKLTALTVSNAVTQYGTGGMGGGGGGGFRP